MIMQKKHEITTVEELSKRLYDLHMERKNSKQMAHGFNFMGVA